MYGALLIAVGTFVRAELLSPDVSSLIAIEQAERERTAEEGTERQQLLLHDHDTASASVGAKGGEERKRKRDTAASIRAQFADKKASAGRKRARGHASEEATEAKMETEDAGGSTRPASSPSPPPSTTASSLDAPLVPGTTISLSVLVELFGDGLTPYIEVSGCAISCCTPGFMRYLHPLTWSLCFLLCALQSALSQLENGISPSASITHIADTFL